MNIFYGFFEYLQNEKKYSQHTITAYSNDLKSFSLYIDETFDKLKLTEVDYLLIRSWIAELSNHGLEHKTINRKLSTLKSFYRYLIKIGEIDNFPLQKLKSLKAPKKLSTPFSISEIDQVILSMDSDDFISARNKLIIELLYATGMRRAELMSTKIKDIDLDSKQIKITGKRNKQRIVPLHKKIYQSIKDYLSLKEEKNLMSEYLLVTEKNKKLYPSLIYKVVNDIFRQHSSKSKTSPHILRHSFATHLLNKGANLNAIKELLGHESLASTEIYTQNSIEQLKESYHKNHPREAD